MLRNSGNWRDSVGHSLRCVVPKPICEELHLSARDVLTVDLEGSRIILEKMTRRKPVNITRILDDNEDISQQG